MHSYAGIDVLLRDITKKGTAIKIEGAHNEWPSRYLSRYRYRCRAVELPPIYSIHHHRYDITIAIAIYILSKWDNIYQWM